MTVHQLRVWLRENDVAPPHLLYYTRIRLVEWIKDHIASTAEE